QYEKARKYLSEQIKDVELEEELLKTCTKIVEEKTTKKVTATSSSTATQSYDKKGEGITSGVTSTIGSTFSGFFGKHDTKSVETTKTVISKQTSEGSFHISDTLSEILDISSDTKSQSFTSTIQTYAVSERLKKTTTHYTWWTTAITISYLKIHASSHETTWKVQYEKARKYLSEQINDVELEEELLKTCSKIVEEKTTKKVTTDTKVIAKEHEGIVSGVTSTIGSTFSGFFGKHDTKSVETTKTVISKQTNEGSFCISDTLSEILDISSDTKSQSFESTIQTYAVSERLKKTTTHTTWWTTAITISYLKLHASSHETTWKVQYEKARKYLSEQIKDVELEEELLKTCSKIVEEKTTKKVTTDTKTIVVEHTTAENIFSGVTSTKTVSYKQDGYINSELIVVGAACYAKCKCTKHFTRTKEAFSKEKANEIIAQYATEEVERLLSSNPTRDNKDDIIKRAKQAASFIIDEYIVKTGGKEC
ncbi:12501_t:CDS:1, partial [Entrophospora sp. SA101]